MVTTDQIKDVNSRIELLKTYLEIDKNLIEIANEEEKASDPDFWNDPKQAESLMRSLRGKKKWVSDYEQLKADGEDLAVMYDFYKEEECKRLAEELGKREKGLHVLVNNSGSNVRSPSYTQPHTHTPTCPNSAHADRPLRMESERPTRWVRRPRGERAARRAHPPAEHPAWWLTAGHDKEEAGEGSGTAAR